MRTVVYRSSVPERSQPVVAVPEGPAGADGCGNHAVLVVDSADSAVEYDETDNRKGECQTLYPEPQATLTVRIQNASAETIVSSQPSGIVCTFSSLSDCTQSYPESSSVTLTAFPPGQFAGWSGCDSVTSNGCQVVMSGDREVTAEFQLPPNGQL